MTDCRIMHFNRRLFFSRAAAGYYDESVQGKGQCAEVAQYLYIAFSCRPLFGFPLFALRLFIEKMTWPANDRIKIFGPGNIKKNIKALCRMAFGKGRPPNFSSWIDDNMQFIELNPRSE